MQLNCAGMSEPERIEHVRHLDLIDNVQNVRPGKLIERTLFPHSTIVKRAKHIIVGNEWVHAIHGDELFRQCIRHVEMICSTADDATDEFIFA